MTIEHIETNQLTSRTLPVTGIYEAKKDIPILMLLLNFSKWLVKVTKNILLAVGTEPLEMTITYHELRPPEKQN